MQKIIRCGYVCNFLVVWCYIRMYARTIFDQIPTVTLYKPHNIKINMWERELGDGKYLTVDWKGKTSKIDKISF